jgi:hypothetical protein
MRALRKSLAQSFSARWLRDSESEPLTRALSAGWLEEGLGLVDACLHNSEPEYAIRPWQHWLVCVGYRPSSSSFSRATAAPATLTSLLSYYLV